MLYARNRYLSFLSWHQKIWRVIKHFRIWCWHLTWPWWTSWRQTWRNFSTCPVTAAETWRTRTCRLSSTSGQTSHWLYCVLRPIRWVVWAGEQQSTLFIRGGCRAPDLQNSHTFQIYNLRPGLLHAVSPGTSGKYNESFHPLQQVRLTFRRILLSR